MLRILAVVSLVGCVPAHDDGPYMDVDPTGTWTGSNGQPVHGCRSDAECGGRVCARDGVCYPAADIRAVHVTWTVQGQVASPSTCTLHPDLYIAFSGAIGQSFGYAPVPCRLGSYTMDKIATGFDRVTLGRDGAEYGTSTLIDTAGDAHIDLPQ